MKSAIQKESLSTYITYGVICLLFLVSVLVLVRVTLDIQWLRKSGTLSSSRGMTLRRHSVQIPNPSYIDSWMTFSYVNQVFGLPRLYLQQQLEIVSTKYPNLQIAQYAQSRGEAVLTFLARVRLAVSQYQVEISDR